MDLASQSNSILVNWINQTKTKNNFISLSYVTDQSAWGLNRSPNGTRISNYYFETNNVIIDFESFFKSYNDTYIGWIPRNFEIFIFKPKLPFLSENHKNDNKGELPIAIMDIFMKNFENNIKGESMKFREWDILMRDIFGYPQLGST